MLALAESLSLRARRCAVARAQERAGFTRLNWDRKCWGCAPHHGAAKAAHCLCKRGRVPGGAFHPAGATPTLSVCACTPITTRLGFCTRTPVTARLGSCTRALARLGSRSLSVQGPWQARHCAAY